eukprot:1160159-Pelagomonas_calceolata.AAC.6
MSLLHLKVQTESQRCKTESTVLMVIWRVTGSTRLQSLAMRSNFVFNGTPSGNKFVGIRNSTGMKLVSKFIGTLVIKFQFLNWFVHTLHIMVQLCTPILGYPLPLTRQRDGQSHTEVAANIA